MHSNCLVIFLPWGQRWKTQIQILTELAVAAPTEYLVGQESHFQRHVERTAIPRIFSPWEFGCESIAHHDFHVVAGWLHVSHRRGRILCVTRGRRDVLRMLLDPDLASAGQGFVTQLLRTRPAGCLRFVSFLVKHLALVSSC